MSPLDSLWHQTPVGPEKRFDHLDADRKPTRVRDYLRHSIADGTQLASTIRLEMTGEIKVKGWMPFTATQVISIDRGFVWEANATMGPLFIRGFDRFLDGVGEMRWKLLGFIPVMTGSGADISRSADDRYAIERILMPSSVSAANVVWTEDNHSITAIAPGLTPITIKVGEEGAVKSVSMMRWGNPDRGGFGLVALGGYVDEEASWGGYTIPSRLRMGWHFGSDQFDDGEFFRAQITRAEFR